MGRKNSPSDGQELDKLIEQYETAKAENHQIYLDGDQFADIADRYAFERFGYTKDTGSERNSQ